MAEYRYRTPPRRGEEREDIGDMDISYGIEHPQGSKENTPVRNIKKTQRIYVPSWEEWNYAASNQGRSERVRIPKRNPYHPFRKNYGGKTRRGHKRSHYRKMKRSTRRRAAEHNKTRKPKTSKNPTKKNMKNKT
tara:strand:+ start:1458 stop:1859 length:402 start_codon:yes stop_codon:yes gene_type:complete